MLYVATPNTGGLMNRQQGIGLPEVLISLLLSSLIMSALVNQYVRAKQHYQHRRTAIEQAFELQLVTDLVRDSIRRAGFTPCSGINHLITVDNRNHHENIPAFSVTEDKHSSLTVNRMNEYFEEVLMQLNPTQLLVTDLHVVNRDRPLLIADCFHAEVHTVSKVKHTDDGQIITLTQPLSFIYQRQIYVGEWIEERYYIHAFQQGKSSLFYQRQHSDELTADVHTMAVQVKQQNNRTLLQIDLGLDHGKLMQVETMVRTL